MIAYIVGIYVAFTLGYWLADLRPRELARCVSDQVAFYGDLCAESSSGYEDMAAADAHFEGVKCAIEGVRLCSDEN